MQKGCELLIQSLESKGVEYIFGIPGAKVDSVFNALVDSPIHLVLCRHEQNAAFMAAAYGRLTGKPGVVLVTSGPGVSNLATGLLTATTEGDPIVAIGANVPRNMLLTQSHQCAHNTELMQGATKSSVEMTTADVIPAAIANAFRTALEPRRGAAFISIPQDVLLENTLATPLKCSRGPIQRGAAPHEVINQAAEAIKGAKSPLLLVGMESSQPDVAQAIRSLLKEYPLPTIGTYQGAGALGEEAASLFFGRVGLFRNQKGDQLIEESDLIITIGYDAVEYDPEIWNPSPHKKTIIHIDSLPSNLHAAYSPSLELIGDLPLTLNGLTSQLHNHKRHVLKKKENEKQELEQEIEKGKAYSGTPIHPLRFIYELYQHVDEKTTICCDIGSLYIWMARHFFCFHPHQLLFSNGQQTLGVALPWAMASRYVFPKDHQIFSMSGDGGFLFSAMELETAVREKIHFIHFIWQDGSYNMVAEQEEMKYHRTSGISLGELSIPDFARGFGALGLELQDPKDFSSILRDAQAFPGPVLINVPIDYRDNPALFQTIDPHHGH
ncbi:MAG: acetolactate synthase AlsS [Chlamydiota bacterium]|nr:acetolactate synthase AlsS [Chlamydiota bacterium]